jgi:PAP2 superfamily
MSSGNHQKLRRARSIVLGNVHWFLSGILAAAIVPAFLSVHLPLAVNWGRLIPIYWVGLAVRAVLVAVVLFVVGFPLEQTLRPLFIHYKNQKSRIPFFVLFAAGMIWKFGLITGITLVVLGVALAELVDRANGDLVHLWHQFRPVFPPAAYFFFGLILVFAYNDFIASTKDPGAYDWLFLKMDFYLGFRPSLSALAHATAKHLPAWGLHFAEYIYYAMFNQIGAALIILAMHSGTKQALRFVGTLLTAYYLALILFFFWPSMGPFYTCPNHFEQFSNSLATYGSQLGAVFKYHLLNTNRAFSQVDTDYFIAFPCLHIAQPLIVLWFLRRWKRITIVLLLYDLILLPSILLLEWHYFVDVIGGLIVAAIAIWLNRARDQQPSNRRHTKKELTEVESITSAAPVIVG